MNEEFITFDDVSKAVLGEEAEPVAPISQPPVVPPTDFSNIPIPPPSTPTQPPITQQPQGLMDKVGVGFRQGVTNILDDFKFAIDKGSQLIGVDPPEFITRWRDKVKPQDWELDAPTLAEKLAIAAGAAGPGIAELATLFVGPLNAIKALKVARMAAPLGFAAKGAYEGIKQGDPMEALKEALVGFGMGTGLRALEPFGRVTRAVGNAAMFGAGRAIAPDEWTKDKTLDVLAGAIEGAAYGGFLGGPSIGKKARNLGWPADVFNALSPKERWDIIHGKKKYDIPGPKVEEAIPIEEIMAMEGREAETGKGKGKYAYTKAGLERPSGAGVYPEDFSGTGGEGLRQTAEGLARRDAALSAEFDRGEPSIEEIISEGKIKYPKAEKVVKPVEVPGKEVVSEEVDSLTAELARRDAGLSAEFEPVAKARADYAKLLLDKLATAEAVRDGIDVSTISDLSPWYPDMFNSRYTALELAGKLGVRLEDIGKITRNTVKATADQPSITEAIFLRTDKGLIFNKRLLSDVYAKVREQNQATEQMGVPVEMFGEDLLNKPAPAEEKPIPIFERPPPRPNWFVKLKQRKLFPNNETAKAMADALSDQDASIIYENKLKLGQDVLVSKDGTVNYRSEKAKTALIPKEVESAPLPEMSTESLAPVEMKDLYGSPTVTVAEEGGISRDIPVLSQGWVPEAKPASTITFDDVKTAITKELIPEYKWGKAKGKGKPLRKGEVAGITSDIEGTYGFDKLGEELASVREELNLLTKGNKTTSDPVLSKSITELDDLHTEFIKTFPKYDPKRMDLGLKDSYSADPSSPFQRFATAVGAEGKDLKSGVTSIKKMLDDYDSRTSRIETLLNKEKELSIKQTEPINIEFPTAEAKPSSTRINLFSDDRKLALEILKKNPGITADDLKSITKDQVEALRVATEGMPPIKVIAPKETAAEKELRRLEEAKGRLEGEEKDRAPRKRGETPEDIAQARAIASRMLVREIPIDEINSRLSKLDVGEASPSEGRPYSHVSQSTIYNIFNTLVDKYPSFSQAKKDFGLKVYFGTNRFNKLARLLGIPEDRLATGTFEELIPPRMRAFLQEYDFRIKERDKLNALRVKKAEESQEKIRSASAPETDFPNIGKSAVVEVTNKEGTFPIRIIGGAEGVPAIVEISNRVSGAKALRKSYSERVELKPEGWPTEGEVASFEALRNQYEPALESLQQMSKDITRRLETVERVWKKDKTNSRVREEYSNLVTEKTNVEEQVSKLTREFEDKISKENRKIIDYENKMRGYKASFTHENFSGITGKGLFVTNKGNGNFVLTIVPNPEPTALATLRTLKDVAFERMKDVGKTVNDRIKELRSQLKETKEPSAREELTTKIKNLLSAREEELGLIQNDINKISDLLGKYDMEEQVRTKKFRKDSITGTMKLQRDGQNLYVTDYSVKKGYSDATTLTNTLWAFANEWAGKRGLRVVLDLNGDKMPVRSMPYRVFERLYDQGWVDLLKGKGKEWAEIRFAKKEAAPTEESGPTTVKGLPLEGPSGRKDRPFDPFITATTVKGVSPNQVAKFKKYQENTKFLNMVEEGGSGSEVADMIKKTPDFIKREVERAEPVITSLRNKLYEYDVNDSFVMKDPSSDTASMAKDVNKGLLRFFSSLRDSTDPTAKIMGKDPLAWAKEEVKRYEELKVHHNLHDASPPKEPGGIKLTSGIDPSDVYKMFRKLFHKDPPKEVIEEVKAADSYLVGLSRKAMTYMRKVNGNPTSIEDTSKALKAARNIFTIPPEEFVEMVKGQAKGKYAIGDALGDLSMSTNPLLRRIGTAGYVHQEGKKAIADYVNNVVKKEIDTIQTEAIKDGRNWNEVMNDVRKWDTTGNVSNLDPYAMRFIEMQRKFTEDIAQQLGLVEQGMYRHRYSPHKVDMREMFNQYKNIFSATTKFDDLPDAVKKLPDMDRNYNHIRYLFNMYDKWEDVANLHREVFTQDLYQWFNPYQGTQVPTFLLDKLPKEYMNPHLLRRDGTLPSIPPDLALLEYMWSMGHTINNNKFLSEVNPVLNEMPAAWRGRPLTVGWVADNYVKDNLGQKSSADYLVDHLVNKLSAYATAITGTPIQLADPNILTRSIGRVKTQFAAGALGPATAAINVPQIMHMAVDKGFGPVGKALSLKVTGKAWQVPGFRDAWDLESMAMHHTGGKFDPDIRVMMPDGKTKSFRELGITEKGWRVLDTLNAAALSPLMATEGWLRSLTLLGSLGESFAKGEKDQGALLTALQKAIFKPGGAAIPQQALNAHLDVVRQHFGAGAAARPVLAQGPLGAMSSLFWSFPLKTVQFMKEGLTESAITGDGARMARFMAYLGFQLSAAAFAATMGYDLYNVYGRGILPTSLLSLPWQMVSNAYNAGFGETAEKKVKGFEDFKKNLTMMIPFYHGWYEKAANAIENAERGTIVEKRSGKVIAPTTVGEQVLAYLNFPTIDKRLHYDLGSELSYSQAKYNLQRNKFLTEAVDAMQNRKNPMEVILKAKKDGIEVSIQSVLERYKERQTTTALMSRIERLPKPLREKYLKAAKEREKEVWGVERAVPMIHGSRPLWGATPELAIIRQLELSQLLDL